MGSQDRDYMRERRLRWDESHGELRNNDGGDEEPPHRGPPWWTWLIVAAVFFGLGAFAWVQRNEETQRPARHGPLPTDVVEAVQRHHAGDSVPMLVGRIMRVVDGDTIAVRLGSGPIEVRLHAIDAPEYDQPGGPEATAALKQHLRRRTEVALQSVDQDSYERLVADVFVGDELVNEWLVKAGYAWAYRRYADDPVVCEWEGEARASHRGVWASAQPMAPWDWRMKQRQRNYQPKDYSNVTVASCMAEIERDRRSARKTAANVGTAVPTGLAGAVMPLLASTPAGDASTSGCRIKGNINSHGDHIYHTPAMRSYAKTQIDESRGERWFCTEADAQAAGWRAPRG